MQNETHNANNVVRLHTGLFTIKLLRKVNTNVINVAVIVVNTNCCITKSIALHNRKRKKTLKIKNNKFSSKPIFFCQQFHVLHVLMSDL